MMETVMSSLTIQAIRQFFSESSWQRGQAYYRTSKVHLLGVDWQLKLLSINALVQGSERAPYTVQAEVAYADSVKSIKGICSCPMTFNCKHVVAALLAAMATETNISSYTALVSSSGPSTSPEKAWSYWLNQQLNRPYVIKPETKPEKVVYILKLKHYPGQWEVDVEVNLARPLKQGGFGRSITFSATSPSHLRAMQPADYAIYQQLLTQGHQSAYRVREEKLLHALLESGRCYWQSVKGPCLRLMPAKAIPFDWQVTANGEQTFRAEDSAIVGLPINSPWFINTLSGECAPLLTDMPASVFSALLAAPPVTLQEESAIKYIKQLAKQHNSALPLPKSFEVQSSAATLQPVLRLIGAHFPLREGFNTYSGCWPLAELYFQYGTNRIPVYEQEDVIYQAIDKKTFACIQRDRGAEKALTELLSTLTIVPLIIPYGNRVKSEYRSCLLFAPPHTKNEALLAKCERLRLLQKQGWLIEYVPSFPVKPVRTAQEWYTEVKSENDWFSLELGIKVDGKTVNLLPILVQLLSQGRLNTQDPILLPDGSEVILPKERLEAILEILTELYSPDSLDKRHQLKLHRVHASRLMALESLGIQVKDKALRKFAEQLSQGIKSVEIPDDFQGELRAYQREGLHWLQFLREHHLGGLLADDMGLGKTLQTLVHLLVEKQAGRLKQPALIITPTSLVANWCWESQRFTPSLKLLALHGKQRARLFEQIPSHELVITTYPLILRDYKQLSAYAYHALILDEAHFVKNAKSQASQLIRQLKANHRIALTGTPMENHLGELWALFDRLLPGLLGSHKQFIRLFKNPIEKKQDTERRNQLAKRIKPFILRRTKEQVVKELPPKTEIVRHIDLAQDQQDLYESIRLAMETKVKKAIEQRGLASSQIIVLDALLKLRQVCCDPRLVKLKHKVQTSAKLDYLKEMLPQLLEEGRRVLLFSTFTSMLALIEEALDCPYIKLTGQTSDRITPIQEFQSGQVPLFLISLKAGGTGLNLTAADTVIHYDPWWNPAAEDQATDRAYRIGQDKPVFVYKLITKGTVEEKIQHLQQRKKALIGQLLNDSANTQLQWTPEDIAELFAPLR